MASEGPRAWARETASGHRALRNRREHPGSGTRGRPARRWERRRSHRGANPNSGRPASARPAAHAQLAVVGLSAPAEAPGLAGGAAAPPPCACACACALVGAGVGVQKRGSEGGSAHWGWSPASSVVLAGCGWVGRPGGVSVPWTRYVLRQ